MTLMPQVETVVVLMLENRSLDNVLGWLHDDGKPVQFWPQGSLPQRFDGIRNSDVNLRHGWPCTPTIGMAHLGAQRWRSPRWSPKEGIIDVKVQMYGNGDGFIADHHWGEAAMGGFAVDFPTDANADARDVMGGHTRDELPVLYGLAESFAASDRWFGSVPTETDPNRAFSLCGTAQGDEYVLQDRVFKVPTLFDGLNLGTRGAPGGGVSWGLYHQSSVSWTQHHFSRLDDAVRESNGRGVVAPYQTLVDALAHKQDIPSLCYIEPAWGFGAALPDGSDFVGCQGNDYHPPAWVGPAEWALNELYVALRSSRQWESMLFVVLFDEHGGLWDHVAPPAAVNPDGINATFPLPFDFTRMGPRVPAILASPFVAPRTVFREPTGSAAAYDHTSLLKTLLGWAGTPASFVDGLGKRVAMAPTFDGVLSSTVVQPDAPASFNPPTSFRDQCPIGWKGVHFDASSLTRDDHHAVIDDVTDVASYLAALQARVRAKA